MVRTLTALAWVLVAALGAAAQDRGGAQEAQDTDLTGRSGCAGVSVKATPKKGSATQGFSARQILDLNFRVRLAQGTQTPSTVEMRYFTPNNHLYQSVLVPVAPETSAEAERPLEGYPFPVKVQKVEPDPDVDARAVTAALRTVAAPAFPVAGTTIVSNALYGTWRAEAWLPGQGAPCALSFAIKP